jgi:hypothetical protein
MPWGVVAVDAVEWGEGAGFHDDAVEGIEAFGECGIVDRVDKGTGMTFL